MARRSHHSELAYVWPIFVIAGAVPAAVVWEPLGWACLIAVVPACLIRDWWVGRA